MEEIILFCLLSFDISLIRGIIYKRIFSTIFSTKILNFFSTSIELRLKSEVKKREERTLYIPRNETVIKNEVRKWKSIIWQRKMFNFFVHSVDASLPKTQNSYQKLLPSIPDRPFACCNLVRLIPGLRISVTYIRVDRKRWGSGC